MAKRARPAAGRPTKAQQAARHAELLRVALDEFLAHGFDQTSMEGIAAKIGMSKRTIYARFKDKSDLFRAAVAPAIDSYTIAPEALLRAEKDSLRATLINVAHLRLANVSKPESIRLQRVLTAQAYHFPDIFQDAYLRSIAPTIEFLETQLSKHAGRGTVSIIDTERTAIAFLSLVVGGPARTIIAGAPLLEEDVDQHVEFNVDLFLHGIMVR